VDDDDAGNGQRTSLARDPPRQLLLLQQQQRQQTARSTRDPFHRRVCNFLTRYLQLDTFVTGNNQPTKLAVAATAAS